MSTYLGQFTDENAELIAAAFEEAGIRWSSKSSGALVRTIFAADWGVRLYAEDERLDEAFAIATRIAPDGVARRKR